MQIHIFIKTINEMESKAEISTISTTKSYNNFCILDILYIYAFCRFLYFQISYKFNKHPLIHNYQYARKVHSMIKSLNVTFLYLLTHL